MIAKANEWGLPLWIVSLDFSKAFDRVSRYALFSALAANGVEANMIHLIKMLYRNQVGRVDDSKHFPIDRGVKQGDVLSPMLFNAVMDIILRRWKQ